MPFSKKNPPTYIDRNNGSVSDAKRQFQKAERKSCKLSPNVSQAMSTWQRQCRAASKKPMEVL